MGRKRIFRASVPEVRRILAPGKDERLVYVRIYGTKLLTTDHWDYVVNHAIESQSSRGYGSRTAFGNVHRVRAAWPDALRTLDTSAKAC